jgi:transposase InsO family protein
MATRNETEGETAERKRTGLEGPNIVWAGDITYIKTKIGWVYLAVVMDLYNREVIDYATS